MNTVKNLIEAAEQSRSLRVLALAFKLQNPNWGSQPVIVAQGLLPYLYHIDWKISESNALTFLEYYETIKDQGVDEFTRKLIALQVTFIRELNDMVESPRTEPLDTEKYNAAWDDVRKYFKLFSRRVAV